MNSKLPRVLFVGRTRYEVPLPDWLAKKWDAIEAQIDYRVLACAATAGSPRAERFVLSAPGRPARLDGLGFYAWLPARIRREIRRFNPDVVVAADPVVGAAALLGGAGRGRRPRLIVEVHGDWRTFTRLYGAASRRLFAPIVDAVAVGVLRRADATRALSRFTSSLVEEATGSPATACFATYTDLSAFAGPRVDVPEKPVAIFVAALEPYKNVDVLAAAWRRVVGQLPEARLILVGDGSQREIVQKLVQELPANVEWRPRLSPREVAAAIDAASVLVLPSWPEGLGRVVIEAFARGRGVVATAAAGILDLVTDGVEGLLVPKRDVDALVERLVRVLSDRSLAQRLGAAGYCAYGAWHVTADEFATNMRRLVDEVLEQP